MGRRLSRRTGQVNDYCKMIRLGARPSPDTLYNFDGCSSRSDGVELGGIEKPDRPAHPLKHSYGSFKHTNATGPSDLPGDCYNRPRSEQDLAKGRSDEVVSRSRSVLCRAVTWS